LFAISVQTFETRATTSDDDLKRGAEKFVTAVESKDASALLDPFSEQGTSFISGAHALARASYKRSEIRKEFETKTGVYCIFFDTKCLREADSKEGGRQKAPPIRVPLRSIIDLVATAKQKRFVTYAISAANGEVTLLCCDRTPDTARQGEDAVNFYFRKENGEWKLRNVEYQ